MALSSWSIHPVLCPGAKPGLADCPSNEPFVGLCFRLRIQNNTFVSSLTKNSVTISRYPLPQDLGTVITVLKSRVVRETFGWIPVAAIFPVLL